MNTDLSDLRLLRYNIIESAFKTVRLKEDSVSNVRKNLNNRTYNVELKVLEAKDNKSFILKVDVDNISEETISGYNFQVSLIANFELKDMEKLEKEILTQYILFSAFPMALGLARTHLANNTTSGFFGRYILPAIDLTKFIDNWLVENSEIYEEE
jgi:uncharacterized membrane protein